MNSKALFGIKAVAVLAVVAGVATSGFQIKDTMATLAAPSGKCGAILTANNTGLGAKLSTWSSVAVSTVAVFDFDTNTVSYDGVDVSDFGNSSAATSSHAGVGAAFTIVAGSFAGNYVLTFGDGGKMNIVSTNSGNTLLMSDIPTTNNPANLQSGICQAL